MKRFWCAQIAPLASREYQRRWISGATKDAYALPEELLDRVHSLAYAVENDLPWARRLDSVGREAIRDLGRALADAGEGLDTTRVPWEDLVERDEAWAGLRDAARRCLDRVGFDLGAWEREQL